MGEKQLTASLSDEIQDLRDDLYRFEKRTDQTMLVLIANLIFIYGMVLENDFIEWIGIGALLIGLISFIMSWIADWKAK